MSKRTVGSVLNLILGVIVAVSVCTTAITITFACLTASIDAGDGAGGADGKSAYELAVENGFEGTLEDWLDSLKGADGANGENGQGGIDGTVWFTGRGLPTATEQTENLKGAKKGDFYINLNTNTVYIKSDGTWELLVNVNEKDNVSKWDGTIPGWQAPDLSDEEVVKNRPVSYVVDENAGTVDLYNAEAFAWFAYRSVIGKTGFEGYTVTLRCDVDLDNNMWIPIGLGARSNSIGTAFKGTFDGNGHTIYNLNGTKFWDAIQYDAAEKSFYVNYKNGNVDVDIPLIINDDKEMPYGLFATTYNATIKNLNIENIDIVMPAKQYDGADNFQTAQYDYSIIADSVATFVGFAHGDLTLQNLRAGSASGDDKIYNCQAAAGIAARIYCGKGKNEQGEYDGKIADYGRLVVENCVNYVDVTGVVPDGRATLYGFQGKISNDKTGGIICDARYYSEMLVDGCENYGDITGHFAGGIIAARNGIGAMESPSRISKCNNYGVISADENGGGIIGYRNVGQNGSNSTYIISDCNNYGALQSRKVKNSAGAITERVISLGGIVGSFNLKSANAVIIRCGNYGELTANPGATLDSNKYFGGIVGKIELATATVDELNGTGRITVASCFNAGTFRGNDNTIKTCEEEGRVQCYGQIVNLNNVKIPADTAEKMVTVLSYTNAGTVA